MADLGEGEGMAQMEHAIHVGVWEVAEELVLGTVGSCMGPGAVNIRLFANINCCFDADHAPSAGALASNTLSSCHFCCTAR